jgi:uncharacterized membrane protein
MESHLRPLTVSEILDRTAQLYRTNFLLFAGIAAVYSGVLLVLGLTEIGIEELLRALHMTKQLPWFTVVSFIVFIPVMVIFAGAAVAANNRAVAWVNLGEPATIRRAYKSTLPKIGRYLWLMTIAALLIWTPFAVIYGGYVALTLVYFKPHGALPNAGGAVDRGAAMLFGLATLALIVLLLAWVVYAVVMALRYSLAVPACVVENLKARKALRRSVELSKGSRGRIFLLGLLVAVIQVGLVMITQLFFLVAAFKQHGELSAWLRGLQQVVGFFTNTFIGPIYATGITLFYYDQRVRKEGYDIEWMMQAAGLTPPVLDAQAAEILAVEAPGVATEPPALVELPLPVAEARPDGPEDAAATDSENGRD